MVDQKAPEVVYSSPEIKPEWRVVDKSELLNLIRNSFEETIYQDASAANGFSRLITLGIAETRDEILERATDITETTSEILEQCRAFEKAIDLSRANQPIPIKKYPDRECIDLNELMPKTESISARK